jgi:hypothetical protein
MSKVPFADATVSIDLGQARRIRQLRGLANVTRHNLKVLPAARAP